MKKGIYILLLITIGITGSLFAQADSKPVFQFVSEKYDFGKIAQGKQVSTNFEFTNSGNDPLVLTDVKPTASTVTADYSKSPVNKGVKAIIKITYNAAAVGVFNKFIVISSNAKTPQKVIVIIGEVVAGAAPN